MQGNQEENQKGNPLVVSISGRKIFSFEEANQTLAVVSKITAKYSKKVEGLLSRLELVDIKDKVLSGAIEAEVNNEIAGWHVKLSKLGVYPKGLWCADFDSGEGYYCWKYPETRILYWHSYSSGLAGRVALDKRHQLDDCEKRDATLGTN